MQDQIFTFETLLRRMQLDDGERPFVTTMKASRAAIELNVRSVKSNCLQKDLDNSSPTHRKSGLRFTMRQAHGTVKHSKCSLSK